MIYGYLRVSTDEQDVNAQQQGVDKFAQDHNMVIDKYISDKGVSGGKDPSKRRLGAVLEGLKEGDIIIASEISRLGRDLYMVMDILHHCMKVGCVIYTVKDKFTLGNDIQSKVLAFAFGLSAEIERQMIQQRTREGLRLRMKMGVLMGRPINSGIDISKVAPYKEDIIKALEWGASMPSIAKKLGVDKNTIWRACMRWGVKNYNGDKGYDAYKKKERQRGKADYSSKYKETPYCVVELPREEVIEMIEQDLTIPQIHEKLPQFTYEQVYDTINCDEEYNTLYRQHAQKKLVKKR